MSLTLNSDRAETAKALLIQLFREKENFTDLLSTLTAETQELEDAALALFVAFDPATAEGTQLDGIGAIVGEARQGRTDDLYRIRIRARILINASSGLIDQILEIARLILADDNVTLTQFFPASFRVDSTMAVTDDEATEIGNIIKQSTAAGVGSDFIFSGSDDADTFFFSTTSAPESSSAQGFSDTGMATGGVFAGLI